MPVLIDDWTTCRVALFPASRRFDLWLGADSVRVRSESIAHVVFFEKPRLPDVAIANRAYQAAEFEALLVGILLICGSAVAQHWSYALAGLSAADLDDAPECLHLSTPLAEALFALGSGAAWICGEVAAHRNEQGRVQVLSDRDRNRVAALPVALGVDARRRVLTPYVGYCPEWICDDADLLKHALAHAATDRASTIRKDNAREVHDANRPSELAIVGHCSDGPAAHLFFRTLSRRASARLIDLRHALSSQCSDHGFKDVLARTSEAAFVFARPLPARSIAASGNHVARLRHWAILRTLQGRRGVTVNRPASGYTNLSKAAHLAFLSELGLPVPPTIATNDQDAAEEFVEAHGDVVYKSVSHARSIASRYSGNDQERLGALVKCPVIFQTFVHGPDYRVHTVGERALATRIKSSVTDYRFAEASFRAGTVPDTIANLLVSAARSSDLLLSGADLRISEREGNWFVFEINRMPAFDFYDHHSGNQVADAIIDLAQK